MHYGDSAQLHGTMQECMERAFAVVQDFEPDEVEVVVNGDAVAGRGIFRNQHVQNILQLGAEQCWWCAWEIKRWQDDLRAHRWVIVRGNHDHSNRENLAQTLAFILHTLGVPAIYIDRSYVGNFSFDERDDSWFEAEHGAGHSSYYANSYAEIRNVWAKFIERAQVDDVRISRFLRAHTHWLNVGQVVGLEVAIDTTGGWHRQERLSLSSAMRNTGVLVYLHDGEGLRIERVEADVDRLVAETRDAGLHYKNMRAAAEALEQVTAWAKERGLC